MIKYSIV